MREVRLYGHLGARFGRSFHLDVRSPAEAIAALKANLKGFEQHILKHNLPGYKIVVGKRDQALEELHTLSRDLTIKIIPVVQGASAGVRIIAGIALLALNAVVPNPLFVQLGVSLIVGGIAEMLFAPPKQKPKEKAENEPSYSFNGPINTTLQGNPIPICYGQLIVGSQVIYLGLTVEQLEVGNVPAPTNPDNGAAPTGAVTLGFAGPVQVGDTFYWEFLLSGAVAAGLKNGTRYTFSWPSPNNGVQMYADAVYDNRIQGFTTPRLTLEQPHLPTQGQQLGWTENIAAPWDQSGQHAGN